MSCPSSLLTLLWCDICLKILYKFFIKIKLCPKKNLTSLLFYRLQNIYKGILFTPRAFSGDFVPFFVICFCHIVTLPKKKLYTRYKLPRFDFFDSFNRLTPSIGGFPGGWRFTRKTRMMETH